MSSSIETDKKLSCISNKFTPSHIYVYIAYTVYDANHLISNHSKYHFIHCVDYHALNAIHFSMYHNQGSCINVLAWKRTKNPVTPC